MEQKLDELLHNLHRYQFADAEQIVTELRHFILDRAHKDAELAFISSKIFNSPDSLLQFLRQNSQMNERILSTVKKRIYELIIEYIKHRKQEVSGYLQQIKGTCMVSFLSDPNSLVREVSLLVLYKLIESYKETEDIIKPADLVIKLLDEIKLRNPAATVKGAIWQLVGLLHANYHKQVGMHIVESQDVQYQMLKDQVKTNKPEIKAIIGMLKGFVHSFQIECTLDEPQRNGLFLILKTLMAPIQDVQNKGVIKAAMKLLAQHANLFTDQIMKQAMDLLGRTLQLCTQDNIEVRDSANDLLGSLIKVISDNLDRNKDSDIKLFKTIMLQFDQILESNDFRNIQLLSAIRAVGIFSKAIQTILGDEKLWNYLQKLTELSEQKLIKEFMEQDKPESDLQNFKYILKKQKQLIAYIESYSFIIRNLNQEPSEKFRLHFMRVGSIGVNNHRKLYSKYRTRFYEAIAQLTMSLSNFENGFRSWIKIFVRDSLTETLKIPDSVIYGGESPAESLEDAVSFWKEYIGKDQIWTELHCRKLYDQLIETCLKDITDLDLSYKVERTQGQMTENVEGATNDQDMQHSYSNIEYTANNPNDQQYMIRLTNFLTLFLPASYDKWLLKFVPNICQILVKKATGAPRIPKLYVLMQAVLEICSKYKYFEKKAEDSGMQIDEMNAESKQMEELAQSDKNNTYNMLLTFLKDLIGKSEEFQDELLESTISLLLKVPIVIIHQNGSSTDNLYLWKGVMIKALGLSQLNNKLALSCINTLESWFNALPVSLVAELYSDILPRLQNFLQVDVQTEGQKDTYFFQDLIKDTKEVKIDRREIANKVIDLLGKIGGHAHKIINNELTKSHDKENFIRWDSEKRLKLTIPLNQRKIDIYLDSCLPRIIDIAKSSNEKQTRIAACELLHGLVLYMIGKSATKPKELNKANRTAIEQEQITKAAFAKLYAKLFPVIIKLAAEIEVVSRQLFEPLIFQIVRWFSSSKVDEHAEVQSLLDALIEGSQSRNNSSLREICCNAVAVFAQWTLKQSTDVEVANIPVNIRSLIRRIESNSNHPDPFRRLSSVLCFGKILMVIKDFDPLVDRYCLEIARNVLSSLKQCHNSLEFSQDVIETCSALLKQIQDLIIQKIEILQRENSKRSVHTSLNQFLDFLFARFTAVETVYRRESVKLWEGLVTPEGRGAIQRTILTKYVLQPGERTFWKLSTIKFETKSQKVAETKKQKYLEQQTQLDTLTSQLEFLNWLVKTAKFKYSELGSKLKIDLKSVKQSIEYYFVNRVSRCFAKSVRLNSVQALLTCKEDREQLTKSSMKLLTQFYQLISILDDSEISDLVRLSNTSFGGSDDFLFDLAIQIVLVPAAHRLNLLVQDYELESQLRRQCDAFIIRTLQQVKQEQINTDFTDRSNNFVLKRIEILKNQLPIIDLEKLVLKANQGNDDLKSLVHPGILTGLLIGYLKIAKQSQEMKNILLDISDRLGPTIELWIESDLPTHIESSRLLVSFMAQLRIPNGTLFNWLTSKSFVYQKTSDLLLTFISDNWIREKVHLGEYLIQKAASELTLLAVFLPIIQVIGTNKKGFQDVLIKQIPQNWGTAEFETEFAEKQVQIYFLIVSNFKESFEKQQTKESVTFISFVIQQAKNFLSSVKHNIYFKRQVLRLVGKLYSLNLNQEHISIHTRMKPSLEYFLTNNLPIVSRDLASNKNEVMNYEQLIQGYLDLLDLSKSSQVFQLLYRVIREHRPMYLAERIRSSLNNFVINVINNPELNFHSFFLLFDQYLAQFFDPSSITPDDNLRWALANKIINRVLETCSEERLEELFQTIFPSRLKPSLDKNLLLLSQYHLYNTVREKTHVMLMLEIFIRRLDQSKEKRDMRNNQYCPGGKGNELNTYIIEASRSALNEDLSQFDSRCSDVKENIQLQELNSTFHISRRYSCAGYTLLSSTIVSTQVKQNAYQNFLFSNWENIIDVQNESLYQFDILTNFNSISLNKIEQKVRKSQDYAGVKEKIFVQEYVTQSFMQTNEKFNSAMVFETQLDPQVAKNKNNFTLDDKIENQIDGDMTLNQSVNNLEIDKVNSHECMKNIKRVLDKMQELFKNEWTKDSLPMFMQALLLQVNNTKFLNVRVFILKLLINNPEIFEPYAQYWILPICDYITGKQKNGKGFHYFHRDLITLLITWQRSKSYTVSQEQQPLFSKVINTIIRLAADKHKVIFNINIEMLAVLMSDWRDVIVIEKDQLVKMLQVQDSTEGSHLWKMTAIQVIALACSFNLPVRNIADYTIYQTHECKFQDPSATKMDPLLEQLLKCQAMNKKQLIFASSEALGKVLVIQPQLAAFVLPYIMQNDVKEKHDIIVNVIEKITREFPILLAQRRIFLKLLSFINNLTGSMRSAIFKSLTRYYLVCTPGEKKDITDTVKAICEDVLSDRSEENQQSFLVFVYEVIRNDQQAGSEILRKISDRLKPVYISNKNEQIRAKFYDLMVHLYDTNEEFKSVAKSSLIRGLSDSSKEIQNKLLQYWNQPNRLSNDPYLRMEQLLTVLYDQEEEQIWLNNATLLMMQVCELSDDFNRKIFDQSLRNCKFQPLEINQYKVNPNRSQPVTNTIQQYVAHTQTQIEFNRQRLKQFDKKRELTSIPEVAQSSNENEEMKDEQNDQTNNNMIESQDEHLKVVGQQQQSQSNGLNQSQSAQNQINFRNAFIRSTQEPLQSTSNPRFQNISSLYGSNSQLAANSDIPQSQAFYKNMNTRQIVKNANIAQNDLDESTNSIIQAGRSQNTRKDQSLAKMMSENQITYKPVTEKDGKIRIQEQDGQSKPSQLAREAQNKILQAKSLMNNLKNNKKNHVTLLRQYRVGEIPDIEIDFKDLLGPIMSLVKLDSTIATEIMLELFAQIYKDSQVESRQKLGAGIKGILQQSIKFDYGIINTTHRIAIELQKIDGFELDPEVVERTGRSSMSFQTSLLLLEEQILK